MIKLITGMPGNGKTLRAVQLLVNAKAENEKLVGQNKALPRNFYSNIQGLKLDYVQPAPKDWRTLPDGSFIVYDEAHQLFPATGKPGRADDPIINQMDEHRHRGFDMVMVTQWPSKIHHEVRQLIGHHEHLHRSMGLELSGLMTWDRVHLDPYDKASKGKASDETWTFPSDLYGVYESATLHTTAHKFKMPVKMRNFLLSIPFIIAIIWGVFLAFKHFLMPKIDDKKQPSVADKMLVSAGAGSAGTAPPGAPPPSDLLPPTGQYVWQNARSVAAIGGIVASETNCRVFNQEGNVLDLTIEACRMILAKPLPFNIYHEYASSNTNRIGGAGVSPAVEPLTSAPNMNSFNRGPSGSRAEPASVGPPADKVKGWIRSY